MLLKLFKSNLLLQNLFGSFKPRAARYVVKMLQKVSLPLIYANEKI